MLNVVSVGAAWGVITAAGILLDATVVRALLVPAIVSLFGRWNWWLPPARRACSGSSPRRRGPEAFFRDPPARSG